MYAPASNCIEAKVGRQDASQAQRASAIKTSLSRGHVLPDVTAIWRGTEFGTTLSATVTTGWEALNKELPGGGWPCGSLAEVLSPQPSVLEWRLIESLRRCRQIVGCNLN